MTPYNGNSSGSLVLSYSEIQDSDGPPKAALFTPMLEGLADDVARLAAGAASAATIQRWIELEHGAAGFDPATETQQWRWNPTASTPGWAQLTTTANAAAASNLLCFGLPLPDESHILELGVRLIGFESGGDPVTMPNIELVRWEPGTGVFTSVANIDDTTTGSGFTNSHEVTILQANLPGGNPYFIDRTARTYSLRIKGEYGTHSLPGLRVTGVRMKFTTSKNDLGAG